MPRPQFLPPPHPWLHTVTPTASDMYVTHYNLTTKLPSPFCGSTIPHLARNSRALLKLDICMPVPFLCRSIASFVPLTGALLWEPYSESISFHVISYVTLNCTCISFLCSHKVGLANSRVMWGDGVVCCVPELCEHKGTKRANA